MLVRLWLVGVAQGADCPVSATPADIDAQLVAAEKAFTDLDPNGFVIATDHLVLLQPCLDSLVSPALAARWHRVIALKLYGQKDEAGAGAAMRAAHALEPAYVWSDDLLPPGPLRALYESAPTSVADHRVPEPRDGALAFDGTVGFLRPSDRASVVQLLDDAGKATATSWLLPTAPLPAYVAVPRVRNRLLIGAGVAATGALATYAGSWAARSSFNTWTPDPAEADPTSSQQHLGALRGRANGLAAGAIVLGVAAGGGVVGAVLVGER